MPSASRVKSYLWILECFPHIFVVEPKKISGKKIKKITDGGASCSFYSSPDNFVIK
jgi:hypothetical protein